MKKLLLLILAAAAAVPGAAQSVRAYKTQPGGATEGNAVTYALPRTTVTVRLVARREVIKKGPYARFAQKYLGVVAPLTDKTLYTLEGASMTYAEEADPSAVYVLENPDKSPFRLYTSTIEGLMAPTPKDAEAGTAYRFDGTDGEEYVFKDLGISPLIDEKVVTTYSNIESDTGFVSVPVDRRETVEMSLEDMAADAASTIFTLRKRRFDLVTGEAGENVFGAGMQAALDEMRRIEDEYLALFLGKRFTQKVVRSYEVLPEAGRNSIIVCRFSETAGLLPDNDLSGRPIVLELTPEKKVQNTVLPSRNPKDNRGTVFYRVADAVRCRLTDGRDVLLSERIPVYQFGAVVEIPVTALK